MTSTGCSRPRRALKGRFQAAHRPATCGRDRLFPKLADSCRWSTQAITPRDCCRARPRIHSPGHFQSSDRPGNRYVDDRSQSTAVIGRRPLEGSHSPNRSFAVLRCWSTCDASRASAVRSAVLALPTRSGCWRTQKADVGEDLPVLDLTAKGKKAEGPEDVIVRE